MIHKFKKIYIYTGYTQKNGAVSKVNKKFISHLTREQCTPSAAVTVQVSHALRAVRFSCLLRGRGACFQDGVAAGKGFLCAPFWGVFWNCTILLCIPCMYVVYLLVWIIKRVSLFVFRTKLLIINCSWLLEATDFCLSENRRMALLYCHVQV